MFLMWADMLGSGGGGGGRRGFGPGNRDFLRRVPFGAQNSKWKMELHERKVSAPACHSGS